MCLLTFGTSKITRRLLGGGDESDLKNAIPNTGLIVTEEQIRIYKLNLKNPFRQVVDSVRKLLKAFCESPVSKQSGKIDELRPILRNTGLNRIIPVAYTSLSLSCREKRSAATDAS